MIGVGIWLGTLGYTVFYYGVQLWAGVDVTLAQAFGFGGASAAGGGAAAGAGVVPNLHLGGRATRLARQGPGRAPVVAPPPRAKTKTKPHPKKGRYAP